MTTKIAKEWIDLYWIIGIIDWWYHWERLVCRNIQSILYAFQFPPILHRCIQYLQVKVTEKMEWKRHIKRPLFPFFDSFSFRWTNCNFSCIISILISIHLSYYKVQTPIHPLSTLFHLSKWNSTMPFSSLPFWPQAPWLLLKRSLLHQQWLYQLPGRQFVLPIVSQIVDLLSLYTILILYRRSPWWMLSCWLLRCSLPKWLPSKWYKWLCSCLSSWNWLASWCSAFFSMRTRMFQFQFFSFDC